MNVRRGIVSLLCLAALAACSAEPAALPAAPPSSSPVPTTAPPPPPDPSPPPDPGPPPNILVVEADDMRADELVWMPRTVRQLGLVFRNSFAPNPLCCPARATFLTGRYSHNHQVLSHEEPYGFGAFDDSDTLATRLQAAGYQTALVGKYLNGYGVQPTTAGEPSLLYVPPGWSQWWAGSDAPPGGGGTYDYFGLTSNVNGELASWPGEYSTEVLGRQTRDLVTQFAAEDDPWFVWWNPVAPHHGSPTEPDDPGTILRPDGYPVRWVTPARPEWVKGRFDEQVERGAGVPRAEAEPEDVRDKPWYLRHVPALGEAELAAVLTVTRQRAEALHVLDVEVAETLRHLRRAGEAGETVVVFTSDNGYYLGEHRKRQGKINLHEPSARVPLLMAGPGIPVGERYDPVSQTDLAVTLAALAGTRLWRADGRDLRALVRDGDAGWRHGLLLEGLMPEPAYHRRSDAWQQNLNTMGVRTARWKYLRYSTGEVELYDLQNDPLELDNVAGQPSLRVVEGLLADEWDRLSTCAGRSCRRPLPRALQGDPELNRVITDDQERAREERFG